MPFFRLFSLILSIFADAISRLFLRLIAAAASLFVYAISASRCSIFAAFRFQITPLAFFDCFDAVDITLADAAGADTLIISSLSMLMSLFDIFILFI